MTPTPTSITTTDLRPPAVPLIAVDPYFSVWSRADRLADGRTTHWTGAVQPLGALVRIDGQTYRVIGNRPATVPALDQVRTVVHPTRTVCTFEGAGVEVTLTFTTPALLDDLLTMSMPITYLDVTVTSADGAEHSVEVFVESPAQLCARDASDHVVASRPTIDGVTALGFGMVGQVPLSGAGDRVCIAWGWSYLAVGADSGFDRAAVSMHGATREAFVAGAAWYCEDPDHQPWLIRTTAPTAAAATTLAVTPQTPGQCTVLFAYDDMYSIEYFHQRLQPYWRAAGLSLADLLRRALADHDAIVARCEAFDAATEADLVDVGGAKYAALATLASRQALAAHKLVTDQHGTLLHFSKENTSNGCLYTVDVTYPAAPFFLYFNPALLRAQLIGILEYAASERWKFPFAPARPRLLPDRQRAGVRRRRGVDPRPDVRRGVRQHAGHARRLRRANRRLGPRCPIRSAPSAVGRLPRRLGRRSWRAAVHRRLRRAPSAATPISR